MGLWKSNLEIFLDNKELNKGDILTLGTQHCNFSYEEVSNIFKKKNYPIKNHKFYKNTLKNLKNNAINAKTFFEMLGFSNVDELDFNNYEGANLIYDLNEVIKVEKKYDLVFDGGTIEHVFDVKNSMTNIVNFLKIGGNVMHSFPLNGWINHGYYNFSPCMFYEFYKQNSFNNFKFYTIEKYKLTKLSNEKYTKIENIYSDFNNDAEIKKTLGVFIAEKVGENKVNYPTQAAYNDANSSKKIFFYENKKNNFFKKINLYFKTKIDIIKNYINKI
jgi:hypothetical protein